MGQLVGKAQVSRGFKSRRSHSVGCIRALYSAKHPGNRINPLKGGDRPERRLTIGYSVTVAHRPLASIVKV